MQAQKVIDVLSGRTGRKLGRSNCEAFIYRLNWIRSFREVMHRRINRQEVQAASQEKVLVGRDISLVSWGEVFVSLSAVAKNRKNLLHIIRG